MYPHQSKKQYPRYNFIFHDIGAITEECPDSLQNYRLLRVRNNSSSQITSMDDPLNIRC